MDTRHTTFRDEAAQPGREAVSATIAAEMTATAMPGPGPATPGFAWQALLMRYLPEPLGPEHSIKRFALR